MKEKLGESTKLQKSLSEEGKDLKKQLHDSILKLKQSDAELQRSQVQIHALDILFDTNTLSAVFSCCDVVAAGCKQAVAASEGR